MGKKPINEMDLQELYEYREELLNDPHEINDEKLRNVDNRISEMEFQSQKEERQQRKEETINEYVDILSDMFDALLPKEIYEQLLGLTEYNEKRQHFYQLNQAYFSEKVQVIHEAYESDLADKDRRIKEIEEQRNGLVDKLETRIAEEATAHDQTKEELVETKVKLKEVEEKLGATTRENDELRRKVMELEEKIESKQQKTEPSQSLKSTIASIRKQNENVDDMLKRFEERQRAKAENGGRYVIAPVLPNMEGQPEGNLFRDETDTQDSGVLNQSADASNQEVQQEVNSFQDTLSNVSQGIGTALDNQSTGENVAGKNNSDGWEAWVERSIRELQAWKESMTKENAA